MRKLKPLSRYCVTAAMLALSLLPSNAWSSRGGMDGGGGSYVVIDGQTKIADPYYAGRPISEVRQITRVHYKDLPKEIRDYLSQSEQLLSRLLIAPHFYGAYFTELGRTFFDQTVFDTEGPGELHHRRGFYLLVPKEREDNVPCNRYLPDLSRPVDEHFQYGCTFGNETYLFVEKWKQAPVEEQAAAIIHERLWAARPDADQADIATFNTWLQRFQRKETAQILYGDRTSMTAVEMEGLKAFYSAASKLGMIEQKDADDRISQFRVVSGGAFVWPECANSLQLKNSFLGMGVTLALCENSAYEISNSTILSSTLYFKSEKSLAINESHVYGAFLKNTNLDHSQIENSALAYVSASQTTVQDSTVAGAHLMGCTVKNGSDLRGQYEGDPWYAGARLIRELTANQSTFDHAYVR
ncbi:MAG: hypothetical protein ACJ763_07315 [Bdellovibrionia bacterium]